MDLKLIFLNTNHLIAIIETLGRKFLKIYFNSFWTSEIKGSKNRRWKLIHQVKFDFMCSGIAYMYIIVFWKITLSNYNLRFSFHDAYLVENKIGLVKRHIANLNCN